MAEKPFPTPILKTAKKSIPRRHSVTFQEVLTSSSEDERGSSQDESSKENLPQNSRIRMTDFGLCYTPASRATPSLAVNTQTRKVVSKKQSIASAEPRAAPSKGDQYNVVMFGDVIHGKGLKEQLEDYSGINWKISLFASPMKDIVETADFFFILLPLEIIGSCLKAQSVLQRLLSLRPDAIFRCAAVGISSSSGVSQHYTELHNLHTLLLQHRLSYYIWCDVSPGSWPNIVRRMAGEVVSCGPLPRPALCSLLWPSDTSSFMLQQYVHQRTTKTGLDLDHE